MNTCAGTVRHVLGGHLTLSGMGAIWVGAGTVLDRYVAGTLLTSAANQPSKLLEPLNAQARHLTALDLPTVATVFGAGKGDRPDSDSSSQPPASTATSSSAPSDDTAPEGTPSRLAFPPKDSSMPGQPPMTVAGPWSLHQPKDGKP
jgi:hypothetical protein